HHGSPAWLTEMGRRLARLPVDPRLARIIIEGDRKGCLREVLIIAAALAIQDPRERPAGREQSADRLHRRFADKDSDFLTWINLWEYLREGRRERTSSQFRRLCRDEFLNYRRVREWQDVHAQLRDVAKDLGLRRNRVPADRESVLRALMAGFLSHIGHKQPDGHEYNGARGARFAISPASSLFKANPEWVMAAELVETKRLWAHAAARIDPAWAEDVGAAFTKRSYSDPWWDPDRGAAVAAETVTLFGLTLVAGRTVQFGRVDPGAARRLFIEHVLVAGEWHTHHDFVTHNAAKINEVLALEARGRRSDLLVDDETVVAFFDARLPADVVSVRHFDRWWKEERLARPDLLKLTTDDLIAPDADSLDDQAFPHVWSYGDLDLPLSYEFDPQSHSDGVTIDLPVSALERIDPAAFDWLVPGLRRELVETLIRSLPKQVRKQFVPIPDTAASLVDDLEPADGGLVESLRRELTRRSGTAILSDAFDLDALPHHLKPKFRIVDGAGSELAVGDDLGQLRRELRDTARSAITGASHELERSGLLTWSIGDLPRTLPLVGAGSTVDAYPALVDEGDAIAVRLLATPAEQADAMWSGTRRLLLLQLPSISTLLRPLLSNDLMLALAVSPYESPSEWMSDIASAAVGELMVDGDAPAWNGQEFERLLAHVRTEFGERAETMARTSANALQVLRRVRGLLNGDFGASFPEPAIDIGNQLDRFIYPGFLTGVGAGRVEDVARYLQAIERRVARIPEDPAKDRDLMYRIVVLERELDYLMDRLPWSEDMIDLAWMLQELRVSVFAQQLGVKGPVSEKRIRRGLDRLTGLAD
ncbi:MAG: ATP-dependent RNA helicase HrpA, partial [Acidimicrobiia bacterium]|nr:ATP-dependent RNA helicase HrpA [Acidimicrobiia bacterium]